VNSTETVSRERVTPWLKIHILGMGAGLSFMGSTLTTFAVVLRDKDVSGPIGVSIIFLAMALPTILLAPVVGLIADRFASRLVIPVSLSAMAMSTISIVFMPIWWAPVALFITASFGAAVGASNSATIAAVTKPDDITRVQGVLQSYVALGMLLGPATGGLLVSAFGYFWPFVIDSVSFLILASIFLAIGFNRKPVPHAEGEKPRALDGVRFIAGNPLIRSIVLLLAVVVMAIGAIGVGEVFMVTDELGGDALIYGLVGATLALGMITGSILVQTIKIPVSKNPTLLIMSITVAVLALITFSQLPHWGWAFPVVFIAGLGNAGLNSFSAGTILRLTSEEIRGRVVASYYAIVTVGNVIATGLGGVLIAMIGVRTVLLGGGVLALIALMVFGPQVLKAGKELASIQTPTDDSLNRD
jgi:MFS family permease